VPDGIVWVQKLRPWTLRPLKKRDNAFKG
jgi:hypothetical protein